eukprot:gnl/Chilomastix_caulleri/4006.p1 GENE.gnl/Chilomastix_caulleri/4006~~gnl/Chilomastix_caulleri/4006.p1  ORF type:complete len:111 (+),score=7.19 gnl/Chilomastix_caulleri/4006:107-439(+)
MLCQKVKEILATEPNVLSLNGPITVCGDIHGQFYDLVELFKVGGDCPYTTYLFMGDWVDRGFFSVETLLWLLALKAQYPDRVALIRGIMNQGKLLRYMDFMTNVYVNSVL